MTKKRTLVVGLSILGMSCLGLDSAFAQIDGLAQVPDTGSTKDLLDLSLEDLMNMKVTVASKKAEKISDAPGMITSYSANDLKRYGYYTLKDLANITSGYSSFSAYGETNLETRGQKAGSWNVSKHLLLVDGIPVNHSRANSAPLEYQVPVFFADRVEFLKGPGSALYGTSAFYGVMNIKSKELKENGSLVESRISYGDVGNSIRIMSNAITKTDVGQMKISFSQFKKGFSGDSLGVTKGAKTFLFDNDNSTFLNTSFKFDQTKLKGLGMGVIYMKRNSHAGEFWGATPSPNNEVTWEEVIPYLRYNRELNDKITVNSYLKMNNSTEKSTYGASWASFSLKSNMFSGYSYTTRDVEGLAELDYKFNENTTLIVGLNAYSRREMPSPTSFDWGITSTKDTNITKSYTFGFNNTYKGTIRVNVASAYSQFQKKLNVLKGLILTAGARFDNGFSDAGSYSQLSPRAGLVLKTTDKLNLKLLYGQALRVPGVKELGLNTETINEINKNGGTGKVGDIPHIVPEVIKSVEAGVNFNTTKLSLALASFYNITKNPLDGTQYTYVTQNKDTITANYFKNTDGSIISRGFEFDAQYAINENFRFMLNHSFAKAQIQSILKDKVGNDSIIQKSNFTNIPTQKTNFSATFTLPKRFTLTAVVRKVWSYRVPDFTLTPSKNDKGEIVKDKNGNIIFDQTGYNPNVVKGLNGDKFDILTGYSMIDLNLQIPLSLNISLELLARNILDTKWNQPSLLGQNSMIPLQGRNFMFTLYAKF